MNSAALEGFLSLTRRDAAIQERVSDAVKRGAPLDDIAAIAAQAGYQITVEELRTVFNSELTDRDLDAVAGGLSAPAEMFAESFTALKPRTRD